MSSIFAYVDLSTPCLNLFLSIFDAIINGIICIYVIYFGVCIGTWVLYIQIQYTQCMLFFNSIDDFPPNETYRMLKKFMTRCSTSLSGKCKSKVQHIPPRSCLNGFYQKGRNQWDWGCVENGGFNWLLVAMYIGAIPMEYLPEVSHEISNFWIYIHFWMNIQRKWNTYLKEKSVLPYSLHQYWQ